MSRKNMTTVPCLQFVTGNMNIFRGDDSYFMDIVADNFLSILLFQRERERERIVMEIENKEFDD